MPSNTTFEMGNWEWRDKGDKGTRGQGEGETRRRRIQLLQFRLSPCPLVPLSPLLLVSPLPTPHFTAFLSGLCSRLRVPTTRRLPVAKSVEPTALVGRQNSRIAICQFDS